LKEPLQEKADRDNHANQLNPNNPAYESSRQQNQEDEFVCDGDFEKLCDSDD
jgi:hypothetical protein